MDTQILSDLGLTNAEIKVYLALLELGSSTAGPILEKTVLQNSVVHMTLRKLINKGFVTFVKEGKRNHYQASNPKNIIQFIEEKKSRFEALLPELIAKQDLAKEKPEIITFRGIRGVKELLFELLDSGGSEHNTFGSSAKSLMLGDAWWVDYHKKRSKKKIKARLLFNKSLSFWNAEGKYPRSEVRYTQSGFEPLTETIVRNNAVAIIVWTDIPLGILMRHREVAESYNSFFKLMWSGAKK
jgi:HTH-type transcriptional regulator, sugar sensing transcriptional regulator